jgi:putative NIF3 family GTP cyclohydrolase 1 type 2
MNIPILRLQLGVDFFVANQTLHQQKATSQHFQQERVLSSTSQDISSDSVHINSDSTHQGKHQAPQFLFNQTTAQTVSKPREDEVEYELFHPFEYSEKYELKSGSKSVKGRLKLHSEFWENNIRANSFVLDLLKEGYKIPFMAQTTPVLLKK